MDFEDPDQLFDNVIRCFEQPQARTSLVAKREERHEAAIDLLHWWPDTDETVTSDELSAELFQSRTSLFRGSREHFDRSATRDPHGSRQGTATRPSSPRQPRPHWCWRRGCIHGLHQPQSLRSALSKAIRGTTSRHTQARSQKNTLSRLGTRVRMDSDPFKKRYFVPENSMGSI